MKKQILLGAALLLAAAGVGVALAAVEADHLTLHRHEGRDSAEASSKEGHSLRFAEKSRDNDEGRSVRKDDDDEDELADDDEGARATPQNGPSDPNAKAPENGLFKDKARPKVEVQ